MDNFWVGKTNFEKLYNVVVLKGFTKDQISDLFSPSDTYNKNIPGDCNGWKHRNECEITENTAMLQTKYFNISELWESFYSDLQEKETTSPLAACLLASNHFNQSTTKKQVFPISNSKININFDQNISVDSLAQVDCHLEACLFHYCSEK